MTAHKIALPVEVVNDDFGTSLGFDGKKLLQQGMGVFENAVRNDGLKIFLHLGQGKHSSRDRIPRDDGNNDAVRPDLKRDKWNLPSSIVIQDLKCSLE